MQLNIELLLNKNEFNHDWRRTMLSFIKSLLENENPELYREYYGQGKTTMKKFNFWCYLSGAEFERERIILKSEKIYLYISSTEIQILMYLQNALIKAKNKSYPLQNGNQMKVASVKVQRTKDIREQEIVVSMLSPFVVRQHNKDKPDFYYIYNEEGFAAALKQNMKTKFSDADSLPIVEPIKGKKVIVKAYGTNIPANLGIYKISGSINQLEELYLNGLGGRHSAGFGKFDIIG